MADKIMADKWQAMELVLHKADHISSSKTNQAECLNIVSCVLLFLSPNKSQSHSLIIMDEHMF